MTRHVLELSESAMALVIQGLKQLDRIEVLLINVQKEIKIIMATEAEVNAALGKIDTATNSIATNLTTVSDVVGTIGTEVDALVTALGNAGVSQALLDRVTALGDKAEAASTALDAQIPVLQAIATKGAVNPVPLPPPPPPPPPA